MHISLRLGWNPRPLSIYQPRLTLCRITPIPVTAAKPASGQIQQLGCGIEAYRLSLRQSRGRLWGIPFGEGLVCSSFNRRCYCSRGMIKGITLVRPAASTEAFDLLSSFFSALGFEPGHGWQLDASRGAPFLAPVGNLEFVDLARDAAHLVPAGILIEVSGLNAIYEVAKGWLAAKAAGSTLSEIADTGWKSRSFTVEP